MKDKKQSDDAESKVCQWCGKDGAVRYRQNTRYIEEEKNFVTLCPRCMKENDDYWRDQWSDFHQGCM